MKRKGPTTLGETQHGMQARDIYRHKPLPALEAEQERQVVDEFRQLERVINAIRKDLDELIEGDSMANSLGYYSTADEIRVLAPPTVADLHAISLGALAAGDGGGGEWRWNMTSTKDDNTGTVLTPTSSTGAGRWERLISGDTYSVAWFGAKGDGVTLDRDAVMACAQECSEKGGGTILFESDKTYLLHHVFPFSHVTWDFNYCNLIVDGREYINPNTGSKYNKGAAFVTDYGGPNYDNPYVADNGDFRYDTLNPYYGGATPPANPASIWRDEQRPLDTAVTSYPVGTRSVVLPGGPQGLVEGDFVYFFSGDHNGDGSGTPDWSNYQHHELELLKISKISGITIFFEEATKMIHRNFDRIAYPAGLSQYGCRYFWGLHRIAPGQVSEDVIFKNLRMHVTPANQSTWSKVHRVFSQDFTYNCLMENCEISADQDNPYTTNNYTRGRNRTFRDCRFEGKLGVTFGIDVAQVGFYVYNCSFNFKDPTTGYIHAGERFADAIIKDSYISYSDTNPNGATWMSSEECENVQIVGNTIANLNSALGCNQVEEFTFGSLVIRDNNLVGHWYQTPLSIKALGKGSNISVVNNNFQMTVDDTKTGGTIICKSGVVTGNVFDVNYGPNSLYNAQRRTTFMNSPYDFHMGTFRDNKGMGNLISLSIAPLNYVASSFTAEVANKKVNFAGDEATHVVEYAINIQDVITDDPTLTKGINWVVWGVIDTASTDTIRIQTNLFSAYDGTGVQDGLKNVNVDLTPVIPGDPFILVENSVGALPSRAITENDLVLTIHRAGADPNDTFTGDVAIHHISITAHGSSESVTPSP
jgi:hypothetical protein